MSAAPSQREAVVALIRALHTKPHTIAELAAVAHMDERAVSAWIKALREGLVPLVMISDWRPDALGRLGVRAVPAYSWGLCGADMQRPAGLTRAQITARHRAKKAGDA